LGLLGDEGWWPYFYRHLKIRFDYTLGATCEPWSLPDDFVKEEPGPQVRPWRELQKKGSVVGVVLNVF